MSTEHDDVRILLGAYVLGGLNEADRRTFESHLPDCAECRAELARSAALAGLLRRAPGAFLPPFPRADDDPAAGTGDRAGGGPGDGAGAAPARPRDRLLERVRADRAARRRRSRLRLLTVAAALVAMAGLGIGVLVSPDSQGPHGPTAAFSAATGYTVSGLATFTAKPWGTSVTLRLSELPPGGPFVLQITARDGHREQAATWATTPTSTAAVTGASSLDLPDIRSLTVLDHEGHPIATAPAR